MCWIHFFALFCICTKISHDTSLLMESSVANGEPGPFFFPSGNLTFEAEWFCMVLLLPILAIEPTKTTKKDVWLPLWHRVGHSHLDPSMKSQPCCTSGKIPNALNRSSSLLIPFFINFKEPFVLGGDCLHCRNKWAHVFKSQCYQISQIFFPHLVWNPTMAVPRITLSSCCREQ